MRPVGPGWWGELFVADPWFSAPALWAGEMTVSTTKAQLLDEVAALVASFPDPFDVPYRTEGYWCRKLPLVGS